LLILSCFTFSSIAEAKWHNARSEHFDVYSAGKLKQTRSFVEKLEKFDILLRLMTGTKSEASARRFKVILVTNQDMVGRIKGGESKNIAGFYKVIPSEAIAVVPRRASNTSRFALDPETILFHEYAHHFMLQYFPSAYPSWYVEGFAEFFAATDFKANGSVVTGKVAVHRLPSLQFNGPMDLDTLFFQKPNLKKRRETALFYATAWLLTHYLRDNDERARQFQTYLVALNSGQTNQVAAEQNFVGGLDALNSELKRYWNKEKLFASQLDLPIFKKKPDVQINALPADRDALFDQEIELIGVLSDSDKTRMHKAILTAEQEFPQSGHPALLMARLLYRDGKLDQAKTSIAKAIERAPNSAQAHIMQAKILMRLAVRKDAKEARTSLMKAALKSISIANRADIGNPEPFYLYYQYRKREGKEINELTMQGLDQAFQFLPQYALYRLSFAQELARKEEFMFAAGILKPLAFAAHSTAMSTYARKLYDRMVEAAKLKEKRQKPRPTV